MKTTTYCLSEEHRAWLAGVKRKYGISASQVLREILDDFIANDEKFGETTWKKERIVRSRSAPEEKSQSKEGS